MTKNHVTLCCVSGCSSSSKSDVSFFSLPTDARREEWIKLITGGDVTLARMIDYKKYSKVCEEHFSYDALLFANTRKTLKKTAMPSKKLPAQESDDDDVVKVVPSPVSSDSTSNVASQHTQTDNNPDETSEHTQWIISVLESNNKVDNLDTFYKLCNLLLTKELTMLIRANKILKQKNEQCKLTKEDFSQLFLNLYQAGPQTYHFFQKTYGLPDSDTLLKTHVKIGTKLNDNHLLTLKARVDKMSDKEKNCSVLIRSVGLKANLCYNIAEDKIYGFEEIDGIQSTTPAATALTIMVRGMFSNWKQLVSYILIPNNCQLQNGNKRMIANWIDSVLQGLLKIGLNVRTLVSSTKEDLINEIMFKSFAVCIDRPFFFVSDMKIYLIFDAPDLIMSIRDSMLLHNFHFENKVATYEDILKFFHVDQTNKLPCAHKLTGSHINPGREEKQELKYAVQLFSKTVANGLWNYINLGLIESAGTFTVEFITKINDLFDALNISKPDQEPFHTIEIYQNFLNEVLQFFKSLKVINPKNGSDVTLTTKFVRGVLVTIKAILSLFDDLENDGHSELLTRNLHRKALDQFIKKINWTVKGNPPKLTTLQFTTACRKLHLSDLQKFTQKGSSKGDITAFIRRTQKIEEEIARDDITLLRHSLDLYEKISQQHDKTEYKKGNNYIKYDEHIHNKIDTPEKHSLLYVCGYLLLKVRKMHGACADFKHYLYANVYEPSLDTGRFQRYNQYKQSNAKSLLEAPCDEFIRFVEQMDEKFYKTFNFQHLGSRVADSLCKDIEEIAFSLPCPCFPRQFVARLFVRIKIFYTIRVNNMAFKQNKRGPKYFSVPKL